MPATATYTSANVHPVYATPLDLTRPWTAIALVDCSDSNLNGDPDRSGSPRIDLDMYGLCTGACLKAGMREYFKNVLGMKVYHDHGANLTAIQAGYGEKSTERAAVDAIVRRINADHYDLPVFGDPLTRFAGRVKGCVTVNDGRTYDPVRLIQIGGTRVSTVERTKVDKNGVEGTFDGGNMFDREVIRYGLYRFPIHFNPIEAARNNVTSEHVAHTFEALIEQWPYRVAAHRGEVGLRRLYVFQYPSLRGGNEPVRATHGRVRVRRTTTTPEPERFEDYEITLDTSDLPRGMYVSAWEDGKIRTFGAGTV